MADASYRIFTHKSPALPEQFRNMLIAEYLRSLRKGNEYLELIEPLAYFNVYDAYFKALLARPDSAVKLAALSDDPDVVLGWALVEPDKLHFVYVKKDYRRIGIAKSLVSEPFSRFSHLTKIGKALWDTKFPRAAFNPFC